MEFGIILGDIPTSVPAAQHFDSIRRQVDAAQRNGFTYIVIGQHFLFHESRWLQPVPLLARLAGDLDANMRLATQIMIAPLYHPVMLAEELATLDIVTEGRLRVGLGVGYLEEEFAVFGVPFEERVPRFVECIKIMKELWTNDRVSYEGRFWSLDDVHVHIRPVQEPYPPLWIGAARPAGIRRAARLGDAWPITPQVPPGELPEKLKLYADARAEAGLPLGQTPLRREIVVGRDHDDALERAVEVAQSWFVQMASLSDEHMNLNDVIASMPDVVQKSFVLGSAEECIEQLRVLGEIGPFNPVITRANWQGMSTEQVVEYLDSLGEELIPALRDYQSSPTVTA